MLHPGLLQLPAGCRRLAWAAARRRYATSSNAELYDIVCVGGGPAGLALLTGLRSHPVTSRLRIALIDGQDIQKSQLDDSSQKVYANRCSSVTPGSVKYLREIGAWPLIIQSRVQPYHKMRVWDGVSGTAIHFDWSAHAQSGPISSFLLDPLRSIIPSARPKAESSTIAYMIENANLTAGLLKRLEEIGMEGVDVFSPARVEGISLGPEETQRFAAKPEETDNTTPDLSSWPHIRLSSHPAPLAARLLIGADGANSPVRAFAGITSRGWDYNAHGVVATLRLSSENVGHRTAYQRFLPTGPIAMLPLPGNMASLVWSTTPERAAFLKSLSSEDFVACVNAAFRLSVADLDYMHSIPSGQVDELAWRLQHTPLNEQDGQGLPGTVVEVQDRSRASFPLKLRHADAYSTSRVALVGDAAHTIHPLAGQGLNGGLGDVEALRDVIADAVRIGSDIGATLTLENYDAKRWAHNNAILGVCDKLNTLYGTSSGPVVGLRSFGLGMVDKMGFVKQQIMAAAAGAK